MDNWFLLNFACLWFPKCGTTHIASMLMQHPDIYIPKQKELNGFTFKHSLGWEWEPLILKNWYEYYTNFFKNTKPWQIKGDFSVHYVDTRSIDMLKEYYPNLKVLVFIRNPVEKLISNYNFAKHYKKYINSATLLHAISDYPHLIDNTRYYKTIKHALNLFGKENVYVWVLERFVKNPEKEMSLILDFLDVDQQFKFQWLNSKTNAAKKVKYIGLHKIVSEIAILPWKLLNFFKLRRLKHYLVMTSICRKFFWWIKKIKHWNVMPLKKETLTKKEKKIIYRKYFMKDVEKTSNLLSINLEKIRNIKN